MKSPDFKFSLLHPRYWLTWIGMGLWRLTALLPYGAMVWSGRRLGRLLLRVGGFRRAVASRNLELCFPEKTAQQRQILLTKNFEDLGISLFEVAMAWWWPWRRFAERFELQGLEHLEQLNGQGALLMAMHYTTLEVGGQVLAHYYSTDGMYRPHGNPVYDYLQQKGRLANNPDCAVYPREDVRGVLKALRRGRVIWYAPDQDYGRKQSVFAPFFGVPAASVTATAKFARAGNAKVLPFTHVRLANGQYRVTVHPPLENFPTGDDVADATRINGIVEEFIRATPEQYLWVHRRFKTRPPGAESVYPRKRKRKGRKRNPQPN